MRFILFYIFTCSLCFGDLPKAAKEIVNKFIESEQLVPSDYRKIEQLTKILKISNINEMEISQKRKVLKVAIGEGNYNKITGKIFEGFDKSDSSIKALKLRALAFGLFSNKAYEIAKKNVLSKNSLLQRTSLQALVALRQSGSETILKHYLFSSLIKDNERIDIYETFLKSNYKSLKEINRKLIQEAFCSPMLAIMILESKSIDGSLIEEILLDEKFKISSPNSLEYDLFSLAVLKLSLMKDYNIINKEKTYFTACRLYFYQRSF